MCEVLDIKWTGNTTTLINVSEKHKSILNFRTLRGNTGVWCVDEAGLYKLIMRSNKPEAEKFQDWVTEEVLPSIRKHGAYMTPDRIEEVLLNPDTIIRLATDLKAEREQRLALEAKQQADKPYTNFGKAINSSDETVTVGEFAKLLRNAGVYVGRNLLYQWFRENGWVFIEGREPKQKSLDMGLMRVRESLIRTVNGDVLSYTTLITGKGQVYFTHKLLQDSSLRQQRRAK